MSFALDEGAKWYPRKESNLQSLRTQGLSLLREPFRHAGMKWIEDRDSNPDFRVQSPVSYH